MNKAWFAGKGEGRTHEDMRFFVMGIMAQMKYDKVRTNYPIRHKDPNSENEWLRRPQGVYHEVDNVGVTHGRDLDGTEYKFTHYVELDGEAHGYKLQQNKDENAEMMIQEYHKAHPEAGRYKFTRIDKEVVLEAMKSGDPDMLCLKLFVNVGGSPLTFLPHMCRELREEKIRQDCQDDDYRTVADDLETIRDGVRYGEDEP